MGINLRDIIKPQILKIEDLKGKVVAIDAFNTMYQFLTTIRSQDGTPLTDENGNVTGHLIGLFYRSTNLMSKGIKLVYCFDGEMPELKSAERQRRREVKQKAEKDFEDAKAREDVDAMRKYASRMTSVTPQMVEEAKLLLQALGIPVVQAPSEGEAQAVHMVKNGDAYAVASQDYDTLIFGAPRIVRNLTVSGRRRLAGTVASTAVYPELITANDTLEQLKLSQKQLVALAILVGTDYNRDGIKGVGPKTAIKQLHEYGDDIEKLFADQEFDTKSDVPWKEVYDTIVDMPIEKNYSLQFSPPNEEKVKEILVTNHNFDKDRIESTLKKLAKEVDHSQKGLSEFF